MSILIIGSMLVGAVLGRFFKVLVILPVSVFGLVVILFRTAYFEHSLLLLALEFGVLITSLQIGYLSSMVLSVMLQRVIQPRAPALHKHDEVCGLS
jgi:hypothetical protein